MLRVEKPGGVVVVCVILCVCLDGLLFSEKTNKRWYRRNSTHPPPFFFPWSFKICKHLIFKYAKLTKAIHMGKQFIAIILAAKLFNFIYFRITWGTEIYREGLRKYD